MAQISSVFACIVLALTIILPSPATTQSTAAPPFLAPSSAPAPAPHLVNLTDLLSVAGPFDKFLNYLVQTRVIETFQNQANNTDQGITVFAPTDTAFSSLKKPSLSNLTSDQLKSLMLYHALPKYYSLAEFQNLSTSNPVSTLAGGQYTLNFTYSSGLIRADSGWSNPKISSSVISTRPVAVYEVQRVLLPTAIFGTAPPPAPAPAPTPSAALKPADSAPSGGSAAAASPKGPDSPSSGSAPVQMGFNAAAVLAALAATVVML